MKFSHLPKIELHLHLDCSLSYDVVCKLRPSITCNEFEQNFIAPQKCTDLADFLKRAPSGFQLMQSEQALRLVTEDIFQQLAKDNVIYAEIRFAPLLHTFDGLAPERVVDIVNDTFEKYSQQTGIEVGIILSTVRRFSESQSLRTAQLAEQFMGSAVVGFDIAGDEAGFPIDAHIPAFRYAKEQGIPCTAHAGEAAGVQSIWDTIDHFKPLRIGHGVRCTEDQLLMEYLKNNKIHLEICPTCNIQTDVFSKFSDHPVDYLKKSGISIGINTDARTITNITLSEEYNKLHQTFDWGIDDFYDCNLNALDTAFVNVEIKEKIRMKLQKGFGR